MSITAVILAGGIGSRMNASVNKVLLTIKGKSIIKRSTEAFLRLTDRIIVVCRPEDEPAIRAELQPEKQPLPFHIVHGGETRQQSVRNGLRSISFQPDDIILIHDAARCLIDSSVISRVIDSCLSSGNGIPAIPATSTYKICDDHGFVISTPDRSHLFEVQTPQGFLAQTICRIHDKAFCDHVSGTDDASLLEHYNIPVKIVKGASSNFKITEPDDIKRAVMVLEGAEAKMRVGMGFDVHRLVEDRKLILCGVEIPYEYGLLGHSDADVALHALMDAMLGACALGDIGKHFPDSDMNYKGISSVSLLKQTSELLQNNGYSVSNIDITIVAQRPRISPFVSRMIDTISETLSLRRDRISIKATTTEKLGFEGRGEGISAYAVCSVTEAETVS